MAIESTAVSPDLDLGEHNHHAEGLRRNALTFSETLAQSIANIAPTATPAVNLQLVFASSGNGTWLTYVLATLGLVLIGNCINFFAKTTATPGSLYSYVCKSLGPVAGFLTGWSLVLAYLTTGIAVVAGAANYITAIVTTYHGNISAYPLFVAVSALVWFVAYKDVRLSTSIMLVLETASVAAIFILGLLLVAHKGFVIDMDQLALKGVSLNGLRSGMVIAVFSFVGFESATALGAEAQNPKKTIPKAVVLSTVIAGTFFVIMSFIMTYGFRGSTPTLDQVPAALNSMAILAGVPWLGMVVSVGATVSLFACALACVTAVSRILLCMARDKVLPASFGMAHGKNATPHIASSVSAVVMIAVLIGMGMKGLGMLDIYGLTGTIATYGFLVAYILIAVGAVVLAAKTKAINPMLVFSAVAGTLFMMIAVVGSVYPYPAAPYNTLPPIFAVYSVLGILWMVIDKKVRSSAVAQVSA